MLETALDFYQPEDARYDAELWRSMSLRHAKLPPSNKGLQSQSYEMETSPLENSVSYLDGGIWNKLVVDAELTPPCSVKSDDAEGSPVFECTTDQQETDVEVAPAADRSGTVEPATIELTATVPNCAVVEESSATQIKDLPPNEAAAHIKVTARIESTILDRTSLCAKPTVSLEPTPSNVTSATQTGFIDAHAPASTRLRQMIKTLDHILVCPGIYDGLSARIALQTGFEGMYMTGAGTTASSLGAADLGIAQLHDMRTNAEMIANLQPDGPPLIADMDTGYGGPLVIARAVQQYHLAGVAGFHIEDQVMQKRCGHLQGKEVVDVETYIQRIKACVAAAKRLRSDIVIIARTDALQSRGYEECIERLRRARDEGADVGMLEGVATKEQAHQAVRDLAPWPLCYNSVENGVSPLITSQEAQEMGYRVIIYSFAAISPAYTAIKDTFERLKDRGTTGSCVSPKAIFQVCGLSESMMIDAAAGGSAFAKGV